jgi:hypothetical protein
MHTQLNFIRALQANITALRETWTGHIASDAHKTVRVTELVDTRTSRERNHNGNEMF